MSPENRAQPVAGEIWEHYSGRRYQVEEIRSDGDDSLPDALRLRVLYRSVPDGKPWDLSMMRWMSTVPLYGMDVPRYALLESEVTLPLMAVGRADINGDVLTEEAAEEMIARFNTSSASVPVTENFRKNAPLGRVTKLELRDGQVMASMRLRADGRKLVARGWEAAFGGVTEFVPLPDDGSTRNLADVKLTDVALTERKTPLREDGEKGPNDA